MLSTQYRLRLEFICKKIANKEEVKLEDKMGLGDPDPSNYKTGFDGADEIVDWFKQEKPDDWRQRD